ncbi:hypothetical protein CDIK_3981 [Cucumispora dikerogammari]|nr:hypothetical protein CDIK_3981 [Cucumispora dikerogammari]
MLFILKHNVVYNNAYPCNTKAFQTVQANIGINKSLMCAISTSGVIGYKIQDSAYNGDLFIFYLWKIIVLYFITKPVSILIMDNYRFHHRLDVKQFLIKKCVNFKYLPLYSL